jgi:cytochrome c556
MKQLETICYVCENHRQHFTARILTNTNGEQSIMKNHIFRQFDTVALKQDSLKPWLLLILGLASANAGAEVDQRQTIRLDSTQRAHVLGEMRSMLSGTQAILAALSNDDMAAVAQQARTLGMNMGHKAENHLHDLLPESFMQLGMSVHQDFDRIAGDAETLKDPKHTLRQLSTTMNTCGVCHETYRIEPVRGKRKP